MRDWDSARKTWIEDQEWEIRHLESSGGAANVIREQKEWLEKSKSEYADFQKLWAGQKGAAAEAAAQQRARDAGEYAEEHDDDYVQAMDEYFDEHNDELLSVPVAGGILQELLTPVFEAFKATPKTTAEAVPVGHSMPESPNEEPLAAVSIRTLLGPPDTNSSKF